MLATRPNGDMGKAAPGAAIDPLCDLGYITLFVFASSSDMANSFPLSPSLPCCLSVKEAAMFIQQLC